MRSNERVWTDITSPSQAGEGYDGSSGSRWPETITPTATWTDVFDTICRHGVDPLRRALPEPWLHAELLAELGRRATLASFHLLRHEALRAHRPVIPPKRKDLCHAARSEMGRSLPALDGPWRMALA